MTTVWATADLHLGHKNITKYRNFPSVADHDKFVVESILDIVGRNDTLWILGDVFFTMEAYTKWFDVLRDNVNTMKIVLGNHDMDNNERRSIVSDYMRKIPSVSVAAQWKEYLLTHVPIEYDSFRDNLLNVHGHLHNETVNNNRYVCVSLEQWDYTPMSLTYLRGVIKSTFPT